VSPVRDLILAAAYRYPQAAAIFGAGVTAVRLDLTPFCSPHNRDRQAALKKKTRVLTLDANEAPSVAGCGSS
jgi:hypothetical protein